MESEQLKVLLIANDAHFARVAADMLREGGGATEVAIATTLDAGLAMLGGNSFCAVLFELPTANTASLFQVTSLAVKAGGVPVIVLGSTNDGTFAVETVTAGAQDYLAREQLDPRHAATHHPLRDGTPASSASR